MSDISPMVDAAIAGPATVHELRAAYRAERVSQITDIPLVSRRMPPSSEARPVRRVAATSVLLTAGALALAACGGGSGDSTTTSGENSTTTTDAPTTTAGPTTTDAPTTTAGPTTTDAPTTTPPPAPTTEVVSPEQLDVEAVLLTWGEFVAGVMEIELNGAPTGDLGILELLLGGELKEQVRSHVTDPANQDVTATPVPGLPLWEVPRIDPISVDGDEATLTACTAQGFIGNVGLTGKNDYAPYFNDWFLTLERSAGAPNGWLVVTVTNTSPKAC